MPLTNMGIRGHAHGNAMAMPWQAVVTHGDTTSNHTSCHGHPWESHGHTMVTHGHAVESRGRPWECYGRP